MSLLAQAADVAATQPSTAEQAVFWVFAVIALGSGLAVITMRNIVHGALMLVLNLLAIAGLYLGLESAFLSIVQVLVYAGAITVLFLFVIMLLGVNRDDLLAGTRRTTGLAVAGVALLAGALLLGLVGPYTGQASVCGAGGASTADAVACVGLAEANAANESGSVGVIAERLFTRYTFPFELAALLLTVATIGATVLGRRHDPPPDDEVDVVDAELAGGPDPVITGDVAPASADADTPHGSSDLDREV
jgi:NADH-quinone oxidoreductase subunit J